ncbi:hypothetical protein [Alienimonas chondri]|uniref:PH domain-containing protein n=1 Tax=Alienimonas chondri TaxID=2681879 RepID=A0ABX1VEN6_9PLAN|nr:hypothetical protein [Alienimonas chondri]NNJ25748.1 hypothetical protein [Alienimonas chondri]
MAAGLTEPPPGALIDVVETPGLEHGPGPSGDHGRLVLSVPPGKKRARSLLIFTLLWNAISWTVAGAFWGVALTEGVDWTLVPAENENGPVPWFVLPLTGLFPAIGVGLAFWWTKMRYTRTLVFAERGSKAGTGTVAVRTEWFGRQKTRSVSLVPGDRATLEEAYQENDVPRHRVRVGPKEVDDRTVSFGTMWDEELVRWVADAINRTLGVDAPDEFGDDPDAPPETVSVSALDESDNPLVRETLDARGRSVIEVPLWPGWPPGKRALVAFGAAFAILWWTILGFTVAGDWREARRNGDWFDPFGLLFNLPFAVAGLVWVSGLIAVCRAKVRTTVGDQFLTVRFGTGLLRYTKSIRRERIEDVVLWKNFGAIKSSGRTHRMAVAAVRLAPPETFGEHFPLSLGGDRAMAATVAALVRHRLEMTGWNPADAPRGDDVA